MRRIARKKVEIRKKGPRMALGKVRK